MRCMLKLFLISLAFSSSAFSLPWDRSWERPGEERKTEFEKFDEQAGAAEKSFEKHMRRLVVAVAGGDEAKADALYEQFLREEAAILRDIEERNKDKGFFKLGEHIAGDFLEKKVVNGREVLRLKSRKDLFELIRSKKIDTFSDIKKKLHDRAGRRAERNKPPKTKGTDAEEKRPAPDKNISKVKVEPNKAPSPEPMDRKTAGEPGKGGFSTLKLIMLILAAFLAALGLFRIWRR